MPWRTRLTRMFIWISVLAWGVLLGGKLFDLFVLVGAWSASPPDTLSLLPYGPRFPVDTGDYFFPSSLALLVCSVGGVIAGWNTPWRFRILLIVPAGMLAVTLGFTILWFWPANGALWAVARGASHAMSDPGEIARLVRQWVTYDWLRVAVATTGFVLSIRAISIPFPAAGLPQRVTAPRNESARTIVVVAVAAALSGCGAPAPPAQPVPEGHQTTDEVAVLEAMDRYLTTISESDLEAQAAMQTPDGMTYQWRPDEAGGMQITAHPNSYWSDCGPRTDGASNRHRG